MFECWRLVGRELREYCPKRLRRRGALHAKGVESVEYEGRRKAVRECPRLEVRSLVPEQHDLNIVEAILPSLDVFFLDAKASMSFDGWKLISFSYQVPNPMPIPQYPAFCLGPAHIMFETVCRQGRMPRANHQEPGRPVLRVLHR